MNDKKLAISEIGVSFPDPSFGRCVFDLFPVSKILPSPSSESRIGVPFIFMLREILQYDTTLAQATGGCLGFPLFFFLKKNRAHEEASQDVRSHSGSGRRED